MNAVSISERPPKVRVVRRPLHGVLLLDKPIGFSSNDALQKAKWLLRAEKAGHTGTLDPLATGVLPLCFGAATKFSQMHLDANKTYEATLKLGQITTTGDAEGALLEEKSVNVSQEDVLRVVQGFVGNTMQTPPMYSALKHEGKPLYEYARAGIRIEREARPVTVFSALVTEFFKQNDPGVQVLWAFDAIKIVVSCSKGTYIRTLAEDIGAALGCGAHLIGLRRTATGDFAEAQCVTLERLEAMSEHERSQSLLPIDALLYGAGRVVLDNTESGKFLSGMRRRTELADSGLVAVYADEPRALLGSAHIRAGELIPTRLLSPPEVAQSVTQARQDGVPHPTP